MARPPKTFSEDAIRSIANEISKVPPKPKKFTIPEVISELKPQINSLRESGYSWTEIKIILAEKGIKTTVSGLSGKRKYNRKQSRKAEDNDAKQAS